MKSKISDLIKLSTQPVAVVQSDFCPEGALRFKENQRGCIIPALVAASKGKVAAFAKETTPCLGGRASLAFEKYPLGWIEFFLSCGGEGIDRCERYKKSPELAREFICNVPNALIEKLPPRKKFLLFMPLAAVTSELPDVIVFLANADQLSALVVLANYNSNADDVKIKFGAGCSQTVLYPLCEKNSCFVGLTDISARKFIDKALLAFSMSYQKFLQLEDVADESFLIAADWQKVSKRI